MNNHNGMRDDHDTHTHTDYSDTYSYPYGIVLVYVLIMIYSPCIYVPVRVENSIPLQRMDVAMYINYMIMMIISLKLNNVTYKC